jgi:hypothetical protein
MMLGTLFLDTSLSPDVMLLFLGVALLILGRISGRRSSERRGGEEAGSLGHLRDRQVTARFPGDGVLDGPSPV